MRYLSCLSAGGVLVCGYSLRILQCRGRHHLVLKRDPLFCTNVKAWYAPLNPLRLNFGSLLGDRIEAVR